MKRKCTSQQTLSAKQRVISAPGESVLSDSVCTPSTSTGASTSVDTMNCGSCACLQTYEDDVCLGTGAEWVQCGCGRWLHEECIDSVVYGDDVQERFCSYCVL